MMDTDRATEETKAEKYPPLEQADRERLYTLLCEAADMGIALDRLLATKNSRRPPLISIGCAVHPKRRRVGRGVCLW